MLKFQLLFFIAKNPVILNVSVKSLKLLLCLNLTTDDVVGEQTFPDERCLIIFNSEKNRVYMHTFSF